MKAIGYCWAEVDDSGSEENSSIPRLMVEAYFMKLKLPRRGLYFEAQTESVLPFDQRTTGQEIDHMLRKGDLLIVPSQDCLFRTATDAVAIYQRFRKRGISIQSLDLNTDIIFGPRAEFIQMVLQPLARSESTLPGDRARWRKNSKRSEGYYLGGKIPFGYTLDKGGKLVPERKQQLEIKRMLTLRAEGLSFRDIAEDLKRKGIRISHMGVKGVIAGLERRSPSPAR